MQHSPATNDSAPSYIRTGQVPLARAGGLLCVDDGSENVLVLRCAERDVLYATLAGLAAAKMGLYPSVTSQHRSTTSYQVPYHIQSLFFESDDRISP